MRLSDVLQANNDLVAILTRIESEIIGKIGTLQSTIDDLAMRLDEMGGMDDALLSPAEEASVVAVREVVARLDAIVADTAPTPPDDVPGIPA